MSATLPLSCVRRSPLDTRWRPIVIATALCAALGCAPAPAPPVAAPVLSANAASPPPAATPARGAAQPPAGYVELTPVDVIATPHGGPAVILRDASGKVLVPIFIGGTEALSIELRLAKRRYARPLTHDLFDAAIDKLGGTVDRVQIDGIRDETFVGSVFVRRGDEIFELDARPSDAIALALGRSAAIWVAPEVIEKAGIRPDSPPPEGGGDVPQAEPRREL